MKAEQIVSLLQQRLPLLTDQFSDSVAVTSITSAGLVASVNAVGHGLVVGGTAFIKGSQVPIAITSLTRNGTTGTLVTATDHDMTKSATFSTGPIELSGSNESEFNGSFPIIQVTNRRTITFTMLDSGASGATGSPQLDNGESAFRVYNGVQVVTAVIDVDNFDFAIIATLPPAIGTITLEKGLRISATSTFERILESYTKQPSSIPKSLWAFVVLEDVFASKSRQIQNDATDTLYRNQQGADYRQQIVQQFSIYVAIPSSEQITGREARDTCEDLFPKITQSVMFFTFESGLAASENNSSAIFVDHGTAAYNTAVYIHKYSFQQNADLTFGDTVGYDIDVAFRDIAITMGLSTGDETFLTDINLDDEALP